MSRYGIVDYWDERYSEDKEPFEWYQRYSGIRHFLTPMYLDKPGVNRVVLEESTKETTHSSEKSLSIANDSNKTSKTNDAGASTPSTSIFPSAKDCRVLIAGCGNSEVGEGMLSDGFTTITNVDFSSVCIKQMNEKYNDDWYRNLQIFLRRERRLGEENNSSNDNGSKSESPTTHSRIRAKSRVNAPTMQKKVEKVTMKKMQFECIDLTKKLPFPNESYDLILCKGTLDAILCAPKTAEKVETMMNECHRVLDNDHGVMVIISYGAPETRLNCFDNTKWKEVKTYTVPKPVVPSSYSVADNSGSEHYVYILFKRAYLRDLHVT